MDDTQVAQPTQDSTPGMSARDYWMIALGTAFPEAMNAYGAYKQIRQADIDNARRNAAFKAMTDSFGPSAGAPAEWASNVKTSGESTDQRAAAMLQALRAVSGVKSPAAQSQGTPQGMPQGDVDLISADSSAAQQSPDGEPKPDSISGPALLRAAQGGNLNAQSQVAVAASRKVAAGIINGQDPGEAFDSIAPILPMLGMSPQDAATLRQTVTKNPGSIYNLISALTEQQKGAAGRSGQGIAIGSPQQVMIGGQPTLGYVGQDGQFHVVQTSAGEDVVPFAYQRDLNSTERTLIAQSGADARRYAPASDTESYIVRTPEGYEKRGAAYTPPAAGRLTQQQRVAIAADADKVAQAGDALGAFDAAAEQARGIIKANPRMSTGIVGYVADMVPGTPAYNLARARDTIISNTAIRTMTEMKSASRTGATGFGQLSERELEILKTQYAALQKGMGAGETVAAIDRIGRVLHNAYIRGQTRFRNTYGMSTSAYWKGATAPQAKQAPTADKDVDDLIKKYGVK